MQNFLVALIVVILLGGGGYYWYSSQQTPANDSMEGMNMTADGGMDAMDDRGATPSTSTEGTSGSNGTNVNVSAGASVSTGAVKEFTVTGKNFSFSPATMTVKKGDRVRITFVNESGTHDLRIDSYNVGTKVIQGGTRETFEFVADKAGSFEYYCSVGQHRQMGMKGTLTVQ